MNQMTTIGERAGVWSAPGRANLMGEHTDYNQGLVLPFAIAQSVTATFTQTQYTLDVSVSGNGTVSSSPTGISCPSTCTMNYSNGTQVTLNANSRILIAVSPRHAPALHRTLPWPPT